MPEPTAFTILSTENNVKLPVVGTGVSTLDSPDFTAASFFPGYTAFTAIRNYSNNNNYISMQAIQDRGPKGCIEFIYRPVGWGWSGTTISGTLTTPTNDAILSIYLGGWVGGNKFLMYIGYRQGTGLTCDLYDGSAVVRSITSSTSANAVADGVDTHFALVWETGGSPNTAELYKNGTLIANSSAAFASSTPVVRISGIGADNVARTNFGAQGVFSSWHEWNYAKRDFTDRFDLRSGMNDLVIST